MKEVKYPGLNAEMSKHGDSKKDLANLLKLSEASVSRKINRKTSLVNRGY